MNLKIHIKNFDGCKIAKIKLKKTTIKLNFQNNGPADNPTKKLIVTALTNSPFNSAKLENLILQRNILTEIFIHKSTKSIFFSKINFDDKFNTKIKNNSPAIVAKFKNLKEIKNFCVNLIKTYGRIWSESEFLQFYNNSLILIIYADPKKEIILTSLLAEFNATTEKGKFQETIVKEHCHPIFLNNAIEKISMI